MSKKIPLLLIPILLFIPAFQLGALDGDQSVTRTAVNEIERIQQELNGLVNDSENDFHLFVTENIAVQDQARHICGKHWQAFTKEQKELFINELTTIIGEAVKMSMVQLQEMNHTFLDEKVSEKYARVRYEVEEPAGKKSVLITLKKDQNWLVYDINVDGVSLLRNIIAQLRPKLNEKGFDGALESMQQLQNRIDQELR